MGRGETVFYYGPGPDPRENDTVRSDTVRFDTRRSDTMRSDTDRFAMPPRVHEPASEVWQRGNPP